MSVPTMNPCAIVPLADADDVAAATAPVAGEAPLVRVVRSVLGAVAEDRVVVVTPPALAEDARACLRLVGLDAAVIVAPAPGSRRHLIRAGLEHVGAEQASLTAVLLCDRRYPLSPADVAARVLAGLGPGAEVVVPLLPVTDTVKTVDVLGSVLGTVDRSTLRAVQFPRGFTASALWRLISVGPDDAEDDDEFDAAVRAGLEIGTVAGHANAIRVESAADARLLHAIIACLDD
ncbi:IspD/TarI family cytidylyltransferase [Mycobacterium antarcticum]|uniref:IspD/TarI family cytidylyltransferase n=1 Tax=Mycolicibacterium sp. TUM20985 TaxID=3023370 RepID=UPI002574681E|nr:2-C-methyl-D-erythritol 4-phosphate cytidylyltransferase [Mycolicibacterium sp. TUM20985]